MANLCGASLQCVAIRVSQLDFAGIPTPGNLMYVTEDLVKLDFNPEMETGQESTVKNAAGNLCVSYVTPDLVKRLTISLEVCVPDPELETMLVGGDLFTSGVAPDVAIEGWAYPPLMVDSNPNGVSVEAWTRYIVDGVQPPTQPYIWWAFPRMKLRQGNRTIDINPMANVYEGFANENPGWDTGPLGDWLWPSDRVVQAAFTDVIPTVQCGGQLVPSVGVAATGATAGMPGSWTPSGATAPANLASLTGVIATPATAWTPGQYVVLHDTSQAHWSGTAWAAGAAP